MRYRASCRRGMARIQLIIVLLIIVVVVGMLFGLLMVALTKVRHAAERSKEVGRMKQLGEAFHNHCSANQGVYLPAAYRSEKEGLPPYSWRVAILPYIEQAPLFDRYNLTEAWDGPNNRKLHEPLPGGFQMADYKRGEPGQTSLRFLVVVGESTLFPFEKQLDIDKIPDGTMNTVMIVENRGMNIHWAEPRDLLFDQMDFTIGSPNGISSRFPNPLVAMADNRVFCLKRDISPAILRQLININDGGKFTKDDLKWTAP